MGLLPRRTMLALPLGVAGVAATRAGGSRSAAPVETEPQYLSMHKTPSGGPPPGVYWYEQNPSSIGQSGIDEIVQGVGRAAAARGAYVFNWESIRWNPSAVAAVRQTLNGSPPAVAQPATDLQARVRAGGVVLRWTPGAGAVGTALQIAGGGDAVNLTGALDSPLVLRRDVTGLRELSVDLPPGTYRWVLITTGATDGPPAPAGLPLVVREPWVLTSGGDRIATPAQRFVVPGP